jgi:hypothetical protein
MPQSLRQERERARVRRAAAAAEAAEKSALDVALAQIGTAFDETAVICNFKIRVERLLRLGPHHPAVLARFGARAELLSGRSLGAAVVSVERWWRDERKAFQIASALGCGSRLSLEVLRELRLILRLMRFKRMEAEYCAAIAALCVASFAIAAE